MKLEEGYIWPSRALISAGWTAETTRYLVANNVVELELNYAKGWRGNDLSFLASLPHLRGFKIIDWAISSVEPVHNLRELRILEVMTYCKTAIRFSEFPWLEDCGLEWCPKCESIFACSTLKRLFINRYARRNLESFASLINLESVGLLNAPVENLRGLSGLKRLRSLRLGNLRRLTSLDGIENLSELEELEIDSCSGIRSLEAIGRLQKLRKLYVNNSGKIESLKPLNGLEDLEYVGFSESTNIIDGDLSPLLHHKRLARVSFQNRRHYSHRRESFGAAYFGPKLWAQLESRSGAPLSDRQKAKAVKQALVHAIERATNIHR